MFRQQTISIPEKLCAFIRHVWLLEPGDPSEGNLSTENLLSIYADGCPGIIFQQSEKGLLLNQNARKTSLQGNIARFRKRLMSVGLRSICFDTILLGRDLRSWTTSLRLVLKRSYPLYLYTARPWPPSMHSSGRLGMIVVSFHPYAMHSRLFQSNGKMPLPALQRGGPIYGWRSVAAVVSFMLSVLAGLVR